MEQKTIAIRPFIGSKDFELSRRFYLDLGFNETVLFDNMSLFSTDAIAFYLQDAYVKDWVDNTMLFVEVADVDDYWKKLKSLNLPARYERVRLEPIRNHDWGRECFLHDPSGILWHFGAFAKKK